MKLSDGLDFYQELASYDSHTLPLEARAKRVLELLHEYGSSPSAGAMAEVKDFLIEIEKWKADCLKDRMGSAASNPEALVWEAFLGAVRAENDIDRILSIMDLKGFGSSTDYYTGQRRAKVASAVLRFLWPGEWGVIDWRIAAMLSLLKKHSWDVDVAMSHAKRNKAADLREAFDMMDERTACDINLEYRQISRREAGVPRAADVDMALFGLSLKAWPQ